MHLPAPTLLLTIVALPPASLHAQNLIINGDFEFNAANGCDFNQANFQFDNKVFFATAFGQAGEIDVLRGLSGCTWGSPPQSGATKVAIHTQFFSDGDWDAFSFDLSSPVQAGTSYRLRFYAESVLDFGGYTGPVEIGLSNSPTEFGTLIFSGLPVDTTEPGGDNWTFFEHFFTAQQDALHLTVRPDRTLEVWNHVDNFSLVEVQGCFEPAAEQIVCHADGTTFTVNIEGFNACTGGMTTLTFTASGGAPGEPMCSSVIVSDGGFCCVTDVCITVPDCTNALGDLDGDGTIGVQDFLGLVAASGACGDCGGCAADLDGDCQVGATDLLALLSNWT